MIEVGLNLMKVAELFGGDFAGVLEVARMADRKGVDAVYMSDHVGMGRESFEKKPGFPYPLDYDGWYEPLSVLASVAAVTTRVKLGTNILVAPLRPAILLAKQLATIDVISRGRVDIGFGVGWDREEFESSNIEFDGRYSFLEEQIIICRKLWGGAPASHEGVRVKFKDFYSLPFPAQGARLPVSIGLPPTPRNVGRIARVADGWFPSVNYREKLAEGVEAVKAGFVVHGRDPKTLKVTAALKLLPHGMTAEQAGIKDPFDEVPKLVAAGVTSIVAHAFPYCTKPEHIEPFIDRLVAQKQLG